VSVLPTWTACWTSTPPSQPPRSRRRVRNLTLPPHCQPFDSRQVSWSLCRTIGSMSACGLCRTSGS